MELSVLAVLAVLVVVGGLFAVGPFLLIGRWERREQQRRVEETQRFLDGHAGPDVRVRRAAVGRVRFPVWHTPAVVGLVVVALLLPWEAVTVVLLVTAAVVGAVGRRPRVVATTDDGIVVIATTWSWHPLHVVARLEHSAWRPSARGLGPQTLGREVIVLRSGQATSLPDAPTPDRPTP